MKEKESDQPEDQPVPFEELPLIEQIFICGKLKYSPKRICQILGLDPDETSVFLQRFESPIEAIRISYDKGIAVGDLEIDQGLQLLSKSGDTFAISELGTRQYHRRTDELKKELFGI